MSDVPGNLGDKLREFVLVDRAVRVLEEAAKELKAERSEMEGKLKDFMIDIGVPSAKVEVSDEDLASIMGERAHEALAQQVVGYSTGGRFTVYAREEIWANWNNESGVARAEAFKRICAYLKRVGLEDMVKTEVNAASLSALARERMRETRDGERDEPFPPSVAKFIKITPVTKLGIRKG